MDKLKQWIAFTVLGAVVIVAGPWIAATVPSKASRASGTAYPMMSPAGEASTAAAVTSGADRMGASRDVASRPAAHATRTTGMVRSPSPPLGLTNP